MDTLAQLVRGGDSGEVILAGRGRQSLLVKKLRGTAEGDRMPAGGRPPLSEQAIDLIATWIDEGATLDGASENQPLTVMSALAWAARATDQQMTQRRETLATKNLSLVAPPAGHVVRSTDHFTVIGHGSEASVDSVARLAEQQIQIAHSLLPGPSGEALFHGRATIFTLPRRYDYSEFAKMVEGRGVPGRWTGHWMFDGIDAYVAVVAADDDSDQQLSERLLGPLVSLAVATRPGDVPRWFAEGIGATITSQEFGQTDRMTLERSRAETYQAVAAMRDAKSFLDQKLTPAQTDRIAAALVASMMDRKRRKAFDQVLQSLGEGKAFDEAFVQAFGITVPAYIEGWLEYVRRS
jgi:hypothetical protein